MTKHLHRALVCAAFMIGPITPALAQKPGLDTINTFPTGSGTNGSWPRGGLAMDSAGALYGTTFYGGNCPIQFPYCGTIYKLTPPAAGQTAWSYSFLHGFSQQVPIQGNNEDGISPISPLTYYQGVLYGTASAGGDTNCGCGIVFSITPGGTYTIMHTFDPFVPGAMDINQWPNGTTPIGGLLINNGTIYGTTSAGGQGGVVGPDGTNGAGIIYSMSTGGGGFTVLHNFDGSLNTGPQGMIIFGQDGAIYGTQFGGGTYNQGVIWRMPIGGSYQVLYNFLGNIQPGGSSDGANPEGRLALGPDGTIYGTTSFGGDPSGDGTAWSIKLVSGTWAYQQIYKFNGNTGGSLPHSGLILAADGALYGTTAGGGLYGGGTFYKLVPNGSAWTYVTLHNFIPRDPNGDSPYGDLLYANNNFYGMNLTGGSIAQCVNNSNGCGTVFQFTLRSGTHNFNGDGFSDIAWRDGSGNLSFWLMNGASVTSSGGVGGVPSAWSIVGLRDFNGDGKSDLLWRDTSGNTAIWFLNGTQVSQSLGVGNIPTAWSVAGTGDFNADGLGDILWRDSTGHLAVWLMSGANVLASASLGAVPTTWTVVGTGDFNGDGMTDILWRDTSGNTSIWFMNGTSVSSAAGVGTIPTTWSVAGTGDFNGDGKSDIVWRDTSGNTAVWLMNGGAVLLAGGLGNVGTPWSIAQTGDFDGDGRSDLMWRDTSGNTSIWYMNGTAVAATGAVGNIPTNWTVQSVNAE
jgi:uncharacterized repeat protein (TIGR03803 family)